MCMAWCVAWCVAWRGVMRGVVCALVEKELRRLRRRRELALVVL